MSETSYTEYISKIDDLLKDLPARDKLIILSGAKGNAIYKYPTEFLEWTVPFVNYPDGKFHPHHEVILAERNEAYGYLAKQKSKKQDNQ